MAQRYASPAIIYQVGIIAHLGKIPTQKNNSNDSNDGDGGLTQSTPASAVLSRRL